MELAAQFFVVIRYVLLWLAFHKVTLFLSTYFRGEQSSDIKPHLAPPSQNVFQASFQPPSGSDGHDVSDGRSRRQCEADAGCRINDRQRQVTEAFRHAWKGYREHAWGKDTLKPISQGHEDWLELGVTLIDSLDTMYMMGLREEFQEAREWVSASLDLHQDKLVNVFETTIRVVGGLLGAYHLSKDTLFKDKAVR